MNSELNNRMMKAVEVSAGSVSGSTDMYWHEVSVFWMYQSVPLSLFSRHVPGPPGSFQLPFSIHPPDALWLPPNTSPDCPTHLTHLFPLHSSALQLPGLSYSPPPLYLISSSTLQILNLDLNLPACLFAWNDTWLSAHLPVPACKPFFLSTSTVGSFPCCHTVVTECLHFIATKRVSATFCCDQ